MHVVYQGPHREVEVPNNLVPGGEFVVENGKAVEVPDELGESLLAHGEGGDERPWRRATAKEAKAAIGVKDDAGDEADETKGGE